jgi:hypothetical protein
MMTYAEAKGYLAQLQHEMPQHDTSSRWEVLILAEPIVSMDVEDAEGLVAPDKLASVWEVHAGWHCWALGDAGLPHEYGLDVTLTAPTPAGVVYTMLERNQIHWMAQRARSYRTYEDAVAVN